MGVYPRAYGEANTSTTGIRQNRGLSPRLRGSHPALEHEGVGLGSIPAPTGKPVSCPYSDRLFQVYPRAYGEANIAMIVVVVVTGLSPRLRGSRRDPIWNGGVVRSIPAPTGKPCDGATAARGRRVYPRAYGEATSHPFFFSSVTGLSPRLRGSHVEAVPSGAVLRSIPAPTGKPRYGGRWCDHRRVYPRAYGEASLQLF